MSPEEQSLNDALESALRGSLTPTMVAMLSDAAIHMGLLNGMMPEQLAMIFAEILSRHMPGIAGVEIRMYGYNTPTLPAFPTASQATMSVQDDKAKQEADEVTRRLLKDFKFDLGE